MNVSTNKRRRSRLGCLAGVLVFFVVAFALLRWLFPPNDHMRYPDSGFQFPPIAEIAGMKLRHVPSRPLGDPDLDVRRELWPRILNALTPSQRDHSPAKWKVLGELEITTQRGDRIQVNLYASGERIGAFSAGPDWDSREYYRGGDTAQLTQALADAYTQHKTQ